MATIDAVGLTLRKNKTPADVKEALSKGMKQGLGRIEDELECAALNLSKVLKLKESK